MSNLIPFPGYTQQLPKYLVDRMSKMEIAGPSVSNIVDHHDRWTLYFHAHNRSLDIHKPLSDRCTSHPNFQRTNCPVCGTARTI